MFLRYAARQRKSLKFICGFARTGTAERRLPLKKVVYRVPVLGMRGTDFARFDRIDLSRGHKGPVCQIVDANPSVADQSAYRPSPLFRIAFPGFFEIKNFIRHVVGNQLFTKFPFVEWVPPLRDAFTAKFNSPDCLARHTDKMKQVPTQQDPSPSRAPHATPHERYHRILGLDFNMNSQQMEKISR
jgi:hypothetical protein